jgi:TonB family protein
MSLAQEAQRPDVQPPAASTIADSEAGLQEQLQRIVDPRNEAESNQFDAAIYQLKVSDDSDWFTRVFGSLAGAKVATRYKETWPKYRSTVNLYFESLTRETGLKVQATDQSGAKSPNWLASRVIPAMVAPAHIYEVTILHSTGRTDSVPGLYIFSDGAFRVLNWQCLYELPNVSPMRIRLGATIAQGQLTYQLPPTYPKEARAKKITGTAVLHAIIGLDGSVLELEVANPDRVDPALAAAAMQAVQQWRYRPTILNGDSVEVDTSVSVTFTLGRR